MNISPRLQVQLNLPSCDECVFFSDEDSDTPGLCTRKVKHQRTTAVDVCEKGLFIWPNFTENGEGDGTHRAVSFFEAVRDTLPVIR